MTDCNFQDPKNLKDILELLDKLGSDSGGSSAVLGILDTEAQKYFNVTDGLTSSLGTVFSTKATLIRRSILSDSDTYDTYSHLTGGHDECALKVAEALKKFLPQGYAALYYLYFMGNKSLDKTIQGGKWESGTNKCNVNSCMLYKWLTDDRHYGKTPGLLKRGFASVSSSLTSQTAENVADALKKAVSITLGQYDGSLQNVLCGFMFVCSWDDALTGHAICFLSTFCSKVNNTNLDAQIKKKFHDNSNVFKGVCKDLVQHIGPFVNSTSGLFAVCQVNSTLYDDLFKDDSFEKYCEWLKEKLDSIIGSLKKMYSDCSVWSAESLRVASSAGPFKYGFVFHDSKWESVKGKAKDYISPLTDESKGSLDELRKCLNGESLRHTYQSPEASTEAITQEPTGNSGVTAAGGATAVLGIGGAGVGAAYGFNLFGLKDIMSGVFGAIRGLVVGF